MPWALISGASTGIGLACAARLAERGWHVLAGVRRECDAARVARVHVGIVPVQLDVTQQHDVAAAAERAGSLCGAGGLAALINNAGIAVGGPLETVAPQRLRQQFEVNVFGAVALTTALLPLLRLAKGRIVNMSSISGRLAVPALAPYASAKFALEALSDSLRLELAGQGIGVVLVEPGPVDTPIWQKAEADFDAALSIASPAQRQRYGTLIAGLRRNVADSRRDAVSPDVVARVVWRALTVNRPRTRYAVGRQAWIPARLLPMLPDRWRDALLTWALR